MEADFMYWMKIVAVSTFTFIMYRLLIVENKAKTKDHYTRPAWNFILKKLYAEYILKKNKKRQLKLMKELRKYENETPKYLPNEESTDSLKFFGTDQDGNSILVKFVRRKHRIAEIWLILRLKSDQKYITYTLPDHPHTIVANAHPTQFEGSGLKLECLVPYSKWRITYTGMLRKGISQTLSDDENDYHFVKLNFFWTAASDPKFWPYEWNTGLIASALATEKWRDGKWKNLINLNDAGGYDQFGSCKGEVRIYENNYEAYMEGQLPKVNTLELNLPGSRHRRWGPHKNESIHRTGVILGAMKDGTVIEVGAFSSKFGVTHSQFGNVRVCNGDVTPIKWTDFHLAALGEYQDQLPQASIIQIEAGNNSFIAVVTFKNNEKVPLFGGYVGEKWNAFIVPVDIVCNCIRGYGVAVFWYPRNIRQFEFEEIPTKIKRIFHRSDAPSPEKQLLSFADNEAQSIMVAGGKGASLAILRIIQETKGEQLLDHRGRNFRVLNALVDQFSASTLRKKMISKHLLENEPPRTGRQRSGSITKTIFPDPNDVDTPDFYVPQGFVLSVSAFDAHLRANNQIRKAIKELEEIAYEKVVGNLEDACKSVQETFMATTISDDLKDTIIPKLDQINFDSTARFAVRSSGVTEDAEELSSAGQNQTFLGLKSNEDIFKAIVKCWSSLYSFQSVLYRKQNIQPVVTSMAVIIQKMVQAESAGVIFSRHFLNGDPSVIIITANYGLGESVVSGKAEPDTYLIKRSYKGEDIEMLAAIPGEKNFIIEMDASTSVTEIVVDEERRKQLCLTEDVALRLGKIAIVLEKFFGTPRDIEFAVTKDKRIFLLQSRAITALNNFTDYEIAHETDTAIMTNSEILTRGNVGEVLSGALTKLTRSIVANSVEKVNIEFMKKEPFSSLYSQIYPTVNDTVFLNVYDLFSQTIDKKPTVMDRAMSLSVLGQDIFEYYPNIVEIAEHRNFFRSKSQIKLRQLRFFAEIVFTASYYRKLIEEVSENLKFKLSEPNLVKYKTSSDIIDLITREIDNFHKIVKCHIVISSNSVILQAFIFGILTRGSKELKLEHRKDVTTILSSIGNVESANVPEMIRKIADSIISSGKKDEFLNIEDEKCSEWLQENITESYQLFKQFMDRHGHRALKEFDLSSKPWSMEPQRVIEMIKTNVKIAVSIDDSKLNKKMDCDALINQLCTPLSNISKKIMKILIPKCHTGVQYREIAKSRLIDAVNEIRRAVSHLSQKMVNEGFLPDKELIYHLTILEIKSIIKHRDSNLIQKAIRRQKVHKKHNELIFEDVSFGIPRPISDSADFVEIKEGDIILKGMPVCGGKVTAKACVIKNFSEIHKLEKGDILITYSTDIAWSPYFNLISGICTEIGGLISHGAVVARECNLPCIVGATKATDKIKHGDKIFLNADDGVIVKVT